MPRANLKFWLALLNLVLVILGFFVQQATKIPFVEKIIAGTAADAKRGLEGLISKSASQGRDLGFGGSFDGRPSISRTDPGFGGLATLYSAMIAQKAGPGDRIGTIARFFDACAVVPDKRGTANMVVVEWEHGVKTQTSYEEIRELIAKESDASVRPWQYSLFGIGLSVAVAMFAMTYFPQPKTKEVDSKPEDYSTGSKKTDETNPPKNE